MSQPTRPNGLDPDDEVLFWRAVLIAWVLLTGLGVIINVTHREPPTIVVPR